MHWMDWLVLAGYTACLVGIAWRASRGQQGADSHLRAGRSLPAWAVVFSILATEISAATYVGVPEAGFKGDWSYLQFAIGNLLGKVALATFVIGLYWKLNLETAYGFLGQRIGPRSQRASAWGFLAGRLIASGVRLYIAAIAFSVVTDASLTAAIVAMAALSTLYTLVGGLKAIVWTDVAQGMTFLIGAAAALWFGVMETPIPLAQGLDEIATAGKTAIFNFDPGDSPWYGSNKTLPMAVLGGFFLVLATHGTDQIMVQHLLNTRSQKGATRSLVTAGLFTFPVVILFLSLGTMLWLYHRHVPATAYDLSDPDQVKRVFPQFIKHVIPPGLRGLAFAGLFAAAIASLGATLNAATATWVSDLFPPRAGQTSSLRAVRGLGALFGLLLASIALFFAHYDAQGTTDLVQTALSAMTIVYGGILGTFACALIPGRRFEDRAVVIGLAAGVVTGAILFFQQPLAKLAGVELEHKLEWPLYIPISAGVTITLALLGSLRAQEVRTT
jgi:solute:Na+ symporter, SSS family